MNELTKLQKRLDLERKAKHGKIAICGEDEYCFYCDEDSKISCAVAYQKWQENCEETKKISKLRREEE